MLNAVKSVLADVLSVSPRQRKESSEEYLICGSITAYYTENNLESLEPKVLQQ